VSPRNELSGISGWLPQLGGTVDGPKVLADDAHIDVEQLGH